MPIYPSTRQLEILCTLAHTRSFSRSAEIMNLSQSALSQAVQQAETLLGVQLFHRTKRMVAPTKPAMHFLAQAERFLSNLDGAIAELRNDSDPAQGRVEVACLASISVKLLPGVVRAFRAAHPNAVVRVRDDDPDGIVRRVRTGMVDLAISLMFEPDTGVLFRPLIEDDMRVICRRGHPLSRREHIAWEDLAEFDLVAMARGTGIRALIDRHLPGLDLFKDATYEVARVPSVLDVVEQSDCVSVIPALMLAAPDVDRRFHHRPLIDPVITRPIGLITAVDAVLSATAQAFSDVLIRRLRTVDAKKFPHIRFSASLAESS
ncbi:MAG TPA: LysR family transcriptional regulator [Stellaceae bacterium]|jgi:DNA-binding transcriptional LysR family regulator|nr:LysR family transcriptional regulator [Stellaceae bacterium]